MTKSNIRLFFSICLTVILLACVLTGCKISKKSSNQNTQHHIILDTDTAADDAMAIILAAKASNIQIEGVTILAGNVSLEQGVQNALMSLEVAGQNNVPVYPGMTTRYDGEAIEPFSVFGSDGMGDADLIHPSGKAQNQNAVDYILETVKKYPDEIEILATGPMTNIAYAISKDPETMSHVKRIWSMGTGGMSTQGNATPTAEYNVYLDPEAYEAVLHSGTPLCIVGLDMCDKTGVRITQEKLDEIAKTGDCGQFIASSQQGILQYYLENGLDYVNICDPVASASLIWDDFIQNVQLSYGHVVTNDPLLKGSVIFYKERYQYDFVKHSNCNTAVVTDIDDDSYLQRVTKLLEN